LSEEIRDLKDLAPEKEPELPAGAEGSEVETAATLPEKEIPVKKMPGGWFAGTGRRKTSVARVRIKPGTGSVLVNGKPYDTFFTRAQDRLDVLGPLEATQVRDKYDIIVKVHGGGPTGQSGAIRLGIARALMGADRTLEPALRAGDHTSRDSRMVERKKFGQHKARKSTQFSKR